MAGKSFFKVIFILFLTGFLIRIGFLFSLGPHFYFDDEYEYWKMVSNFISGKGLIVSETLKAYRPPAYPLFIAILVRLGIRITGIRVIQAAISSATSILIYLLGRKIFSEKVSFLAAIVWCIYPFSIFYSGFLLTETLFVFLVVISIFSFLKIFESGIPPRYGIVPGFMTGLAGLCRPTMELFFPFALVPVFFTAGSYRVRLLKVLFIAAGFVLALSPWIIRNFVVFGRFIPGTTMGGAVFWEGNNPYSDGGPCRYFPEGLWQVEETRRDGIFYKLTIDCIKQDPERFIHLMVWKFFRFWNVVPNASEYSGFLYRLISVLSFGMLLPFFVMGLFTPPLNQKKLFLMSIIVFFTIFHMVFLASIRYRFAIEPLIILFSCQGLFWLYERIRGINQ